MFGPSFGLLYNSMEHNRILLQLHDVLISSIVLPDNHKSALRTATQHLLAQASPPSSAVQLTLAIGQCCILKQALQQQLADLVREQALLHVLLAFLPHVVAAEDHAAAATLIRAIRQLIVLHPTTIVSNTSCPVAHAWSVPQHCCSLLQAACSSPTGAEEVAAVAVAAAARGLPAALMFKDNFQPAAQLATSGDKAAAAAPLCSKRAWATVGLCPMVLQLQQQLQSYFLGVPAVTTTERPWQHQDRPGDAPGCAASPAFQQVWLLLCATLEAADGQLLDSSVLATVEGFCSDPAVVWAIQQVALLHKHQHTLAATEAPETAPSTSGAPAAAACIQLGDRPDAVVVGPSTSPMKPATGALAAGGDALQAGSSSFSRVGQCVSGCSSPCVLRSSTLQLIRHVAAHSISLTQQCFSILSPIMPQVLMAIQIDSQDDAGHTSEGPAAAAAAAAAAVDGAHRAAVLQVWHQLLLKGRCSFTDMLRSHVQQVLPSVLDSLAAVAAAVGGVTPPTAAVAAPSSCAPHTLQLHQQQQWVCVADALLLLQRVEAVAACVVPLSGAAAGLCCSSPLLSGLQPLLLIECLTPRVPALLQLLQTATTTSSSSSMPFNSTAAADGVVSAGCRLPGAAGAAACSQPCISGWVLLLTLQLLHALPAALNYQHWTTNSSNLQPAGCCRKTSASAASTKQAAAVLCPIQPQLLACVSSLLLSGTAGNEALQVRCQTAALDLARALLLLSRQSMSCHQHQHQQHSSITATAGRATCSLQACATRQAWQQLVSALVALFSRYPRDPMSVPQRQMLHTACLLLLDLAPHLAGAADQKQQQLVLVLQEHGVESGLRQQHGDWGGLQQVLLVLHDDLAARKMARSSSREELLQALSNVLELLKQLGSSSYQA